MQATLTESAEGAGKAATVPGLADFPGVIVALFPRDPLTSFVSGNMLQIVITAAIVASPSSPASTARSTCSAPWSTSPATWWPAWSRRNTCGVDEIVAVSTTTITDIAGFTPLPGIATLLASLLVVA